MNADNFDLVKKHREFIDTTHRTNKFLNEILKSHLENELVVTSCLLYLFDLLKLDKVCIPKSVYEKYTRKNISGGISMEFDEDGDMWITQRFEVITPEFIKMIDMQSKVRG